MRSCGSSREESVYALYDYGIRCMIAPSFGDIFSGNAVQNGLRRALVSDENGAVIIAKLVQMPERAVTVALEKQRTAVVVHQRRSPEPYLENPAITEYFRKPRGAENT